MSVPQTIDSPIVSSVLLASHYDMLATVIGTLRIAPDHPRPPTRLLRRGRSADRVRGGGRGTHGA